MHDITPKSRKSMSDVHRDVIRRPKISPEPRPASEPVVYSEHSDRIEHNPFFEKQRPKNSESAQRSSGGAHVALWVLAIVILAGTGFGVASYFSSAKVEITPVSHKVKIDNTFASVVLGSSSKDDLVFNFATSTEVMTKEVLATIEKKIQKRASGEIIIFNAYSADKQKLIKNTRIESSDHKIFRIDESVIVPGAKVVKGRVVEPGSVSAVIYADAPGKEYNIGLSDFTIPSFKGEPRYSKFTAKSKSNSPIQGGYSGTVMVPSDEIAKSAIDDIKNTLKKTSIDKVRAQIPDDMSVFPGSIVLKFEDIPQGYTMDDTVDVSVRATVSAFFFNTDHLTKKLAETSIQEYKGNSFTISDMQSLAFSFADPVDSVVLSDITKLRFKLTGDALFVGVIDGEKIRTALAGKEKKDFAKIVVSEQNVGKAEAVIRPMWNTVFPSDPSKITIKLQ